MQKNYTLGDTILYLDNVELGYGTGSDYKCVLKNISLEEKDVLGEGETVGQVIAILGRSGRGKSTLFKALTGLVKPKSGSVLIKDLNSIHPNAACVVGEGDVGFVDQRYTLFRHKTVLQTLMSAQRKGANVPFYKFAERRKIRAEKKAVVEKYLLDWGLEPHKNKYPCELSGGQRQRTALIEQMLSSGHYMVLDEPFSGLDVGNIKNVKNSFNKISNDHELNTIIFSTHDMKLAVELADSIYIVGHKDGCTDYSTVVKHYDLKAMGLAWQEFGQQHLDLLNEITHTVENS